MKNLVQACIAVFLVSAGYYLFSSDQSGQIVTERIANKDSASSVKARLAPATLRSRDTSSLRSEKELSQAFEKLDLKTKSLDLEAQEKKDLAEQAYQAFFEASALGSKQVLDRFSNLNSDCPWCGDFFKKVESELRSTSLTRDEKIYHAKALAHSGAGGSVQSLVNFALQAPNSAEASVFTTALKETQTTQDIVDLFSETLDRESPASEDQVGETDAIQEEPQDDIPDTLTEAMLSALTRDGSLASVEAIYEHTVDNGDPNGYYSIGIGLGQLTPQPEAIPFLEELATKRDEYSHLAIKALLNFGAEGTTKVFEFLSNSSDLESDKTLLHSAVDHIKIQNEAERRFVYDKRENGENALIVSFADYIIQELEIDIPGKDREYEYTDTFEQGLIF